MTNKWNFKNLTEKKKVQQVKMSEELGISPILTQLLIQRGIEDFDAAKRFFRPDLADLHDPFLMPDMHSAIERLNLALMRKEKILVYGDYDVDGTTAVALVYTFLKKVYSHVDFYIPDRYGEGYGISIAGIDFAAEHNFSLIIALDCGIKAIKKVEYANSKGIDFIICDHHTPDEDLPDAVAVLDAKRKDSKYPYDHLSGCGVGFKLMQAFAISNKIPFSELMPMLDLVAVSIASDIVPITGENRVMAFFGLKQLNTNPSLGLKNIIAISGLTDKEITISDIVFKIGPRINASGRVQTASAVVELLVSKDELFSKQKSEEIDQYNQTRKDLDKSITDEAFAFLENLGDMDSKNSIVVYNKDWHKGVIGIVASRLTELYYKPTVVLTKSNGFASGSARSVPGFDIYKAIDSCRDLLENFGGHMYAAGLTLREENIPEFMERFEGFVAGNILPEQKQPQIDIDAVIEFKDITPKFFRVLKQFAPFGPDNMKPVFCSKRVFDYGTSRLVGKGQEHLKMELVDSSCEDVMNGIAFRMHEYNEHLKALNPLDICYTIEENNFNGNSSIQLVIKDIKTDEIVRR
jgi:single-stranded-DNA-specific exonuclease